MAGVLFIVCVPRAEHEKSFSKHTNLCKENKESQHVGLYKCRSDDGISHNLLHVQKENLVKCKSDLNLSHEDEENKPLKKKARIVMPETERKTSFDQDAPMEKILNELLERLHVKNAVWCLGKEKKYYQVFFTVESGALCEEAIHLLGEFGVGTRCNSVVSVIPCALYYRDQAQEPATEDLKEIPGTIPSAWSRFVSSVRSRTTLAQLLQDVTADATVTFDWLFLLLVAALVSAIGLVENSTVFLVASMLISPLMGPIMACAVGTAVRDGSLQRMGFIHELFGLFLALIIGFLFGLIICAVGDNYGAGVWPTYEMISRCEVRSLWVGVLIALPSAAAVTLAVLGGYTASLVGVAISASLLPPAVNAGLLWSMALSSLVVDLKWNTGNVTSYSENVSIEIATHGSVSLCLTVINVLCIYIGGVIVYKIKEVAPMDPKNMLFWKSKHTKSTDATDHFSKSSMVPGLISARRHDYLSWYNAPDKLRMSGRSLDRQHDTWSPYTTVSVQRSILMEDIEQYWRQHEEAVAENYNRFCKSITSSRCPKGYTQLLSEGSLPCVKEDPGPSSSNTSHARPNHPPNNKKSKNSATRFTVTPATLSPNNN